MATFTPSLSITPSKAGRIVLPGGQGAGDPGLMRSILCLLPPFPAAQHVLATNFREHIFANYGGYAAFSRVGVTQKSGQ